MTSPESKILIFYVCEKRSIFHCKSPIKNKKNSLLALIFKQITPNSSVPQFIYLTFLSTDYFYTLPRVRALSGSPPPLSQGRLQKNDQGICFITSRPTVTSPPLTHTKLPVDQYIQPSLAFQAV